MSETLSSVWDQIWTLLRDPKSAARFPTLATMSENGPEARTLALREADEASGSLVFYTDAATPKVAELTQDPRCAVHLWDDAAQVQLRFKARATLTPGAAEVWATMPFGAQEVYGVIPTPGTPIDAPESFDRLPDPEKFLQVSLRIDEIDYVNIGLPIHRRALFRRGNGWQGQWLAP